MEGRLDTQRDGGVLRSRERRTLDSAHTPGNHIYSLASFSLGTRSTPNAEPTGSEHALSYLISTLFPHPAQLLPTGTWDSVSASSSGGQRGLLGTLVSKSQR